MKRWALILMLCVFVAVPGLCFAVDKGSGSIEVNWLLLLEYLKVILSWPLMGLVITLLIIFRFRGPLDDFLKRLVEGNIFGQVFKAVPPREQQQEAPRPHEDRLTKAAEADSSANTQAVSLPAELKNDPQAASAVVYVKNNPVQTVIEYKRLFSCYTSERLLNLIYGTQIELLSYLASRPNESVTLAQLAQFHEKHQKLAGRTDYQIRDYVQFLVNFSVVAVSGPAHEQIYRISQHGVEFLSYIKANYPNLWNQRSF